MIPANEYWTRVLQYECSWLSIILVYRTRYCAPSSFVTVIIERTCRVIANSARKQLNATAGCSSDLAAWSFSLFSFKFDVSKVRFIRALSVGSGPVNLHVCACTCTSSVNSRVHRTPRWLEQLRAAPIASVNRAEQEMRYFRDRSRARLHWFGARYPRTRAVMKSGFRLRSGRDCQRASADSATRARRE